MARIVIASPEKKITALKPQARFLEMPVSQLITWAEVEEMNLLICKENLASHGRTSDGYEVSREYFESIRDKEVDLVDLAEEFRKLHRMAPFLMYNGNTFSAILTSLISEQVSEYVSPEKRSILAHHVTGVALMNLEEMKQIIPSFVEVNPQDQAEIDQIKLCLEEGAHSIEAVEILLKGNQLTKGEKELILYEMKKVAAGGMQLSEFLQGLEKRLGRHS